MLDPRIRLVNSVLTKSDHLRFKERKFDFPEIESLRDLSYDEAKAGDPDSTLDVFWPKGRKDALPVMINIHGGGFVYGDKKLNQWTSAEIASRGYIVFSLNYPLIPDTTIPEQVAAIERAFLFIDGLDDRLPMDKSRVFLSGDSAGGLLAIRAAAIRNKEGGGTDSHVKKPSFTFRGLALIHPMIDINRRDFLAYTKKYYTAQGKRLKQPIELAPLLPPVWIVSSRNDVAFNKEARMFVRTMRRIGKSVEYHEFPFTTKRPLLHIFMVTMNTLHESQRLYDSLDKFMKSLV